MIICEDLSIGYENIPVAEQITFSIEKGNYVCVVGENGSGKTTFLRTLLGILKPLQGTITFNEGFTKNQIGYLPQQTQIQKDFPASGEEVVLSGCMNRTQFFFQPDQKELAKKNMERLGIESLAKRSYRTLSGGQQQRVLLARALCANAELFVLDEPVTGLDPDATKEMYQIIENLHKEGHTILMISHDVSTALHYASHILSFDDIVRFETKQAFLERMSQL